MGFLGGAPLSTPREELETATKRFQPTLGLAASTAFEESRSLFGFKPLQDLSEIAKLRGHEGTELFGVNAGAFDLMRDKEIDGNPTSRLLDPDEANETFGIEDQLKFTVPISEDEARFKQMRKIEEMDRNYILQQNKGFMNNLATFGIEFVADITDPIGLATLLFPVTSFRTVAKLTQKAGGFTPYAVGMGEAAVGVVVPMTPGYFASQEFQYDFTPGDYGISLAGGIAIGGVVRRLLHMRDTKGLINMTNAERDNFNATEAYLANDLKTNQNKIDDIVDDTAAERTPEANRDARQHTAVQVVEGKLDHEWMSAYNKMADDLPLLGRTPIKASIEKFSDNIEKLIKNRDSLKELLKTVPKGEHTNNVKKLLAHTEGYIKQNKQQRKKLIKQEKKRKTAPEGKKDPKVDSEKAADNAYEMNSLEHEVTSPGSTTRKLHKGGSKKKANNELVKKIRQALGDDANEFLDNKKLKDAFDILSDVIRKEGALTMQNVLRALKRDGIDPEKVRTFLEKAAQRLEKPQNIEMSSGDVKAIDYQEGVDLTSEQRVANDVGDDTNSDTEFGNREYSTEGATAQAADDQHETVESLFDMMEKNVKSDKNPRGVYSENVIKMIKERWKNDELDDVKTENALVEYDRCARRNN